MRHKSAAAESNPSSDLPAGLRYPERLRPQAESNYLIDLASDSRGTHFVVSRPQPTASRQVRERFIEETNLHRESHRFLPAFVRLCGIRNGDPCRLTRQVVGKPLFALAQELRSKPDSEAILSALKLAAELCDALIGLRQIPLLRRLYLPSSLDALVIAEDGQLKLLDYIDPTAAELSLNRINPDIRPPEQIKEGIDAESADVYRIGRLLRICVDTSSEIDHRFKTAPFSIQDYRGLPKELIGRLAEHNPGRRFQTLREAEAAIAQARWERGDSALRDIKPISRSPVISVSPRSEATAPAPTKPRRATLGYRPALIGATTLLVAAATVSVMTVGYRFDRQRAIPGKKQSPPASGLAFFPESIPRKATNSPSPHEITTGKQPIVVDKIGARSSLSLKVCLTVADEASAQIRDSSPAVALTTVDAHKKCEDAPGLRRRFTLIRIAANKALGRRGLAFALSEQLLARNPHDSDALHELNKLQQSSPDSD